MHNSRQRLCALLVFCPAVAGAFASAYDVRPKLVVTVISSPHNLGINAPTNAMGRVLTEALTLRLPGKTTAEDSARPTRKVRPPAPGRQELPQ